MKRFRNADFRLRNLEFGINIEEKIRNPSSPLFSLENKEGGRTSEIRNQNGIALIIVVAIIAILSAIGITFMYTMRMEEKAAFNYVNSLKASYIAKSGIEHAIAVLKSDGGDTGYDVYSENWGYQCDDLTDSIFSAYVDDDYNSWDNDAGLYLNSLITQSPGCPSGGCTEGRDSRWIYVTDDNGDTVGRYAVLVIDESSKININTAGDRQNQGWSTYEVSFLEFLAACGFSPTDITNAWDREPASPTLKRGLRQYRYGSLNYSGENVPGRDSNDAQADDDADSIIYEYDGIDNDADWNITTMDFNGNRRPDHGEHFGGNAGCDEPGEGINEPDEFVSWKPYYSGNTNFDTPLITTEEIKNIYGIATGTTNFNRIKPYITVYSSDENTTDSGFLRMNINLVKDATALYTVMYDAWESLIPLGYYTYDELRRLASQVAVNTIDYADRDNVSTFLKITDVIGAETTIARGVEGIRINEIMVKPAYQWEAEELFENQGQLETPPNWSNDSVDTFIYSTKESDTITANIELKREGYYRVRVLSYDDCTYSVRGSATNADNGTNPFLDDSDLSPELVPGEWVNATIKILSGLGKGQVRWIADNTENKVYISGTWDTIPVSGDDYEIEKDNSFDVRLYYEDEADTILEDTAGAHNIGGWLLEDLGVPKPNPPFKSTDPLRVGKYRIELETSAILNHDTGARLDYIQFSQQPDCEYVELVNISARDINIGGWELTTSGGFVGRIPNDTTIFKKDYMVLTVDRDDNFKFMHDNPDVDGSGPSADNICFRHTWDIWTNEDIDEHVRALKLSTDPVNIAENVFGDTIVLRGSIFEDSPLATPIHREDYGTATFADNYTLEDSDHSQPWERNQWKGATITANIVVYISGVPNPSQQITRQVLSNNGDTVTINTRWAWDSNITNIEATNYYIFFPLGAITLWEGSLADRKVVAEVDYRAEDVNKVCYPQSDGTPVYGFIALEKNDPTAISDNDGDGVDDFWLLNKKDIYEPNVPRGGTPGEPNRKFQDDNRKLVDVEIRNLPFATIGALKDVSTSDTTNEWSRLGYEPNNDPWIEEIKALADKITVSDKRLEAENWTYYLYDIDWGVEEPSDDTFLTPYYSTSTNNDTGIWAWGIEQRINPDTGIYDLYISGKILKTDFDSSDTMLIRVTTWYGGGTNYGAKALSFSEDNIAYYGQIAIDGTDNPDTFLQLEIWKEAGNAISFDAAILAPEHKTYGVININTADTVVLQALPGINDIIAQAIVDYRDGNPPPPKPFHTIGEILDVLDIERPADSVDIFSKISNLITTKSKIFTIISQGQALRQSDKGDVIYNSENYEILGEKKYIVVMER